MTRHNSRARDKPPQTIFSIHENGGFGEERSGKWYGRVVARRLRGAGGALPPYFRNCENVGGTPQEDEPTQHQARCRSTHSNGNIKIQDPPLRWTRRG